MKLLYQGNALDPQHVKRQRRFASVCREAVGAIVVLAAFWIFTVLMFCM